MPQTTTIKVPKELRDRLAQRAEVEHLSLSGVIARALDELDAAAFWSAVHAENALLTERERADASRDSTISDDLADELDDDVSRRNGW